MIPSRYSTLIDLAREAGSAVMALYQSHLEIAIQVDIKSDDTPVTAADHAAHDILRAGLKTIEPDLPVLSEEGEPVPWSRRQQWQEYWLIDPLDGTREFIRGTGEFCICIARIEKGFPVFGIIHAPVSGETWLGGGELGSWCIAGDGTEARLLAQADPDKAAVIITSLGGSRRDDVRRWREQLAANWPGGIAEKVLGSALKFCHLASGTAQAYPRFGAIGEWDVAAGQAILEAAGGLVVDSCGRRLAYNQSESLILGGLMAVSSPVILERA